MFDRVKTVTQRWTQEEDRPRQPETETGSHRLVVLRSCRAKLVWRSAHESIVTIYCRFHLILKVVDSLSWCQNKSISPSRHLVNIAYSSCIYSLTLILLLCQRFHIVSQNTSFPWKNEGFFSLSRENQSISTGNVCVSMCGGEIRLCLVVQSKCWILVTATYNKNTFEEAFCYFFQSFAISKESFST